MINIIGRWKVWFLFSGVLLASSIVFLGLGGLRLGIDFTGGTLWEVRFGGVRPVPEDVLSRLAPLNVGGVIAQPAGEKGMVFRLRPLTNDERGVMLETLRSAFGDVEEVRFDTIGPTIGQELRQRAFLAVFLVLGGIIVYLAWAFRRSGGAISPWLFGLNAILALVHDLLITVGAFAVLGYFMGVEVDALFVTALLTILGFSVHDTIVVFDRIREGVRIHGDEPLVTTVNRSVNETLARSINTSLTALVVLVALFVFGVPTIRYFVLALIIGITIGTYSSIFIASPLLLLFNTRRRSA